MTRARAKSVILSEPFGDSPKVDYAIFPFQVNEKFGLSKKTQINAHQTATLIMRLTRGAQSCVSLVYKSPLYIFSMLHHDVNSPRNSWLRHWNPERCLFTLQWSCSSWVNVVKFSASERLHNCLVPQLCCICIRRYDENISQGWWSVHSVMRWDIGLFLDLL